MNLNTIFIQQEKQQGDMNWKSKAGFFVSFLSYFLDRIEKKRVYNQIDNQKIECVRSWVETERERIREFKNR